APCTAPDATITVEILTDNYGGETTWELVEQGTGVVASGGPYASNTLYTVDIDVCSTHCYDFTIFDSYGDGICCSYGNGYYEVYYEGVLVGSGGDFGSSETVGEIGGGCPYDPTPANDCNGNGVPDECDPDCNGNGVPDDCDIAGGTSPDCQPNEVPDECDIDPTDPDGNGQVSEDCQPDGIPDECQLWDEDDRGRAYCEPCYSNITDDWISEVIFNTINNSTGPEGAPCSFGDYTALSTFLDVGGTYTLTVTVPSGTWTQYAKAWIDWNQDEVFDLSESYALGSGASQTFTMDITVPASALEGCTRMRIQERWLSDPTDPCESYTYGEAEDYTVCVGPPAVCGDGVCAPGQEDCCNCPADCGACYCGNGTCDPCISEDCMNCPADCGPCITIYQWDDGTHENALGITAGATIGALNHFTAMTAANTIVSIHVAWGSMANGLPGTVYLWSDPDGDGQPHDAQVLASADVVTANADTDIFNVIPIAPTPLGDVGTSFFVGFLIDSNEFPASMDENGTLAQESWIVGDGNYSIDPNNLGSTAYTVPIDQPEAFGFPCNFMIRAEGIPSGAPPNDCNENGVPDECDIPPICDPAVDPCSLDCNGNGTPDECEDELVLCNGIDLKPGSCPNSFNRKSRGVLHTALWGAEFFDIYAIDIASIRLKRADGIGGEVAPHEGPPGPHSKFYDEATPYYGESCHELEGDSVVDLSMYFQSEIVTSVLELEALPPGALVELYCTGTTLGGTPFTTRSDWIRLVPPGAPPGLVAVSSTVPDVWVDVYPLDLQLDGGGWADFERTYPQTSVMFLTAPRIAEGVRFARWEIDGEPQARGQTNIEFEVVGEMMEARAVYMNPGVGEVQSGGPAEQGTGAQPVGGMTPVP
ncbi:MAG: hypothetical protein JSV19_04635, partial [Phycisphaerales bacterium]